MALTYKYCDGYTLKSTDVTLTTSACVFDNSYSNGTYNRYEYKLNLTFNLTVAPVVPLDVRYSYHQVIRDNGRITFDGTVSKTVTIPAGLTTKTFSIICATETNNFTGDRGERDVTELTTDTYTLLPQSVVPTCAAPPPSCNLGFTDITITDVTLRGGSDGEISIAISGTTGASANMTYSLNGVVYTNTGALTGYTFTGLTTGYYNIYVAQADGYCYIVSNDNIVQDGEFRTGDFFVLQPTGLTAVENPILVQVQTAINNPNPLQDIVTFTFSGSVANNSYVTFNLTSPFIYNQTFYAKGFPSKTNYFLATQLTTSTGVPAGTNTDSEIAVSFADALNNDSLIPKVYNVNVNNNVVTLVAKETGSKYNLTNTNVIISGNITFNEVQAGIDYCDGQIIDNYSISCEVMANTDTTTQYPETGDITDYNLVAELILPFNQINNVHNFDVSSILKSQVNTPIPDMTLTGSTLLISVMQPWFVKLNELYPLVANTNTIKKRYKTSTDIQWTINSSLDRFSENNMDTYLGHSLTNINPNFGFTQTFTGLTTGTTTVTNYLLNTGDTGTTNIKFSVWNNILTTKLLGWQTSPVFNVSGNSYYMRISGNTDGNTYMYQKYFVNTPYTQSYDTTIYASKNHQVKFLTNSPNPKQIQRNSNEFLYFVLPKNYGAPLIMKGDLYFYDGTSATGQTFFTIATGTTNAGGCMVMNLSYDKLGLQNYEVSGATNRKIKRAVLAVYQNDFLNGIIQYTETKTYQFEIDEQPRKFGILFQNALGMYDAFDFIGVVESTIERKIDEYTVPLSYNIDGSLPQGFKYSSVYGTKITKRVTVNTGWIDSNHFDWLMELLKSNNIYSTSTTNQNYLKLTEFSYKKSSLDDLYDAEFTFLWTIFESNVNV